MSKAAKPTTAAKSNSTTKSTTVQHTEVHTEIDEAKSLRLKLNPEVQP